MTWKPTVGAEVTAPWGFDRIPGTIADIHGPPGRRMATVIVTLQGARGEAIGEETVSMPLDSLEPRGEAAAAG